LFGAIGDFGRRGRARRKRIGEGARNALRRDDGGFGRRDHGENAPHREQNRKQKQRPIEAQKRSACNGSSGRRSGNGGHNFSGELFSPKLAVYKPSRARFWRILVLKRSRRKVVSRAAKRSNPYHWKDANPRWRFVCRHCKSEKPKSATRPIRLWEPGGQLQSRRPKTGLRAASDPEFQPERNLARHENRETRIRFRRGCTD